MITELYDFFNNLHLRINSKDRQRRYKNMQPVPYLVLDNFLPEAVLQQVAKEAAEIPAHFWNEFTRGGSHTKEGKAFHLAPTIQTLVHCFNSGVFINWLEGITGKNKLISDPHLVGGGLSTCGNGKSLKLHTDFNWNEQLSLNRSLSMILYLSKEWDPSWQGGLEFWDLDRKKCVHKIEPKPNRLLLWNYNDQLVHGHPNPIQCPEGHSRDGLRMFYFTSNASPVNTPHRSLYWFNDDGAYDIRENQ